MDQLLLADYLCVSLWDEEGECISCLLGFSQVSPGFSPLCADVSDGQVFTNFATKGFSRISIREIEVNVFSFIHQETGIIH